MHASYSIPTLISPFVWITSHLGTWAPDKDQAGLVTPVNTNPTVHVRVLVLILFILVVDAVVNLVILVILVVDQLGTKLRQKSLPHNQ